MGIRGLTTFINNRSHLYLKEHELHNCNVVIDGNSIASNLYKWHCKSNDCFGGDYDKFAHVIINFFDLLGQCNITPYVILDGGYERRKLKTVLNRMQNKIRAAHSLNAVTEGSESVFPLFLREVFVDIALGLGLKIARCEFEGDMEIAGIARTLECPVLSYDSDFYVFGCLYIPFSTMDLTVRKGKDKSTKNPYSFLSCKIYHMENFLRAFGGLDRKNLPLFAVLLGNDYVNGKIFAPFFRNLKIQKCSGGQSDQQKRIKSVIIWLQNEDIESAISKVLSRFKDRQRQIVLKKILAAMKGYFEVDSELLKHLNIEPRKQVDLQLDLNKLNINDEACAAEENGSDTDSQSGESDNENNSLDVELEVEDNETEQFISDSEEEINVLSNIFQKNYRKCQYPACLMDMVTLRTYYCIPQVEDGSSEHSHTISLDILNSVYKILTPNSEKKIRVVARTGKGRIRYSVLSRTDVEVPTLEAIEKFTVEKRKVILFNLLSIDNKFRELLKSFPVEWHLFLMSLKYAVNKGSFDKCIIISCIICFIILHYVDAKIGFYRVSKTFDKKFASALLKIKSEDHNQKFSSFDVLPYSDCLVCMDKMITYFQMDAKLKTNFRLYDKTLVHSLSQLQSVFLHVKYLNSLLNNPFALLEIHKIFDGTFLYNMTMNLRKRTNINEYLDLLLKDCPCVLEGIKHVLNMLDTCLVGTKIAIQPVRRHKKKKRKTVDNISESVEKMIEDEEKEAIFDPNNPYSILSII